MKGIEAPDADVTRAQRQVGAAAESFANFQSVRSLPGSANAAFSFGTHALRPASGAQGDNYYETDRGWLYYYTGSAWAYEAGVNVGTDATRAGIAVTAIDNGALFFTTDTGALWRVEAGAWVNKFVTISATTAYKVGANQVLGARGAAVGDVASADATDLASVITLANELKAQVNTAFARLRSTTGHGLWT